MTKRNIALKIAYQGQGFAGWQCQPGARTVEGELRRALAELHRQVSVCLYGAGRTDSGVHATGQVANFYSDLSSLPAERFREALNSRLPKDLRILQSREVPHEFHSRYSARMRVYHYRILAGHQLGPAQRQNAWYVRLPALDTAVLNCMVSPLIGQHDFSAFTLARKANRQRRIYAASFYCEGPFIVFRIAANAFLWRMVRSIVGSLVGLYGQYSKTSASCEEIYQQRYLLRGQMAALLAGRCNNGCNAPAHGLTLSQVLYSAPLWQQA